jgi:hypothetical protein
MLTVFAPAIRTYENLRHFPLYFRNLSEAAARAAESDAIGLVPPFTTLFVRQTPKTLGENRRGDDHVQT